MLCTATCTCGLYIVCCLLPHVPMSTTTTIYLYVVGAVCLPVCFILFAVCLWARAPQSISVFMYIVCCQCFVLMGMHSCCHRCLFTFHAVCFGFLCCVLPHALCLWASPLFCIIFCMLLHDFYCTKYHAGKCIFMQYTHAVISRAAQLLL